MNYRPHLLPKVRSEALTNAIGGKIAGQHFSAPMPCTVRISGLVPGHRCADQSTVVAAHTGNLGKGVSTKVSDIACVAACMACHDLIDGRDSRWWWLMDNRCFETMNRIITAQHETLAMLIEHEIVVVKGGELI
ncbi:nuclease domain-containing protein [Roseovarius sp. MMSF_3281]|uniref:nuclease domain-containing protein n=1 Tax=Roseovarius sp. MMSF_3281 TaxID=3046694 RepID=UPI00273E1CB0|nr:nuclease domain-containing protein [Roseovarius sp. MMSF_3281]